MDNQRNLILAVVLSAVLLFGWDFAMNRLYPQPVDPPPVTGDAAPAAGQAAAGAGTGTAGSMAEPAGAATLRRDLATELARPERVRITTPRLSGSISLQGARIDDITLTDHRRTVDRNSGPVRLFAPAGTSVQQFAQFGWVGEGVPLPGADTPWQVLEGERLTPETPVTLGWDNGAGQRFTLTFSIDDDYMITVRQAVANTGAGPIALSPYAFVSRTNANADPDTFNVHSGPISASDATVNFSVDYDDLAEAGSVDHAGRADWVGFTEIYWLSALVPDAERPATSAHRSQGPGLFRADLYYQPVTVAPGAEIAHTTRLFAGAKESAVLDKYEDQGIARFGLAIDWGWFRILVWPLWQVLIFFFHLTGNFGVAIICLTIVVRAAMFPIAQKQFASMAQMRVVQPKIKALQDRYKDDKPRLQQEMARLFKEEGVNPLAGCLPIFLQIPIFFALYKVLLLAIEMRHEPFMLWIRDLSAPDPATILNLFGLLPFQPPGFLAIGVLAVLLGVTMWLQFRLNPQPMDPVQQQVFAIMPWVLMFVMAPFAAGLLLYWITSNVLTLAQQKYLYARHPQLKAQAEKDAAEKARAAEREKAKG